MTQLAVVQPRQASAIGFEHQMRLAESFAKSQLFGIKSADQALALMALCEAEGMHPAIAMRDYHIIQGKPALKADAMLARFQSAGGKVKWLEMTDERVAAEFSHPSGGTVTMDWDKARAQTAGFWGKDNWKKFPRAMLRARVISEGIRTVFPGVIVGVYTPEEVQDFDEKPSRQMKDVTPPPVDEAHLKELMDSLNETATKGIAALQAAWTELDKKDRALIGAERLAELKSLAAQNEAQP